jgi:hypothetical protein
MEHGICTFDDMTTMPVALASNRTPLKMTPVKMTPPKATPIKPTPVRLWHR